MFEGRVAVDHSSRWEIFSLTTQHWHQSDASIPHGYLNGLAVLPPPPRTCCWSCMRFVWMCCCRAHGHSIIDTRVKLFSQCFTTSYFCLHKLSEIMYFPTKQLWELHYMNAWLPLCRDSYWVLSFDSQDAQSESNSFRMAFSRLLFNCVSSECQQPLRDSFVLVSCLTVAAENNSSLVLWKHLWWTVVVTDKLISLWDFWFLTTYKFSLQEQEGEGCCDNKKLQDDTVSWIVNLILLKHSTCTPITMTLGFFKHQL